VNNQILDTLIIIVCFFVIWLLLGILNMLVLCPIYFKYYNKIHKHVPREEMDNNMIGMCLCAGPFLIILLSINEYNTWAMNNPNIDIALLCRKCANKINTFWKLP